jgi:hypothetical protein
MLEGEVLLLPALMRRLAIRSDRRRRPRDARELELAREVLFLLRSGLEFGDPDVRSLLGTLSRALSLPGSDRVNAFDASPLTQASERLLLQQLEHELLEGRLRVEELALPQIRDVERIEAELAPLPPAPSPHRHHRRGWLPDARLLACWRPRARDLGRKDQTRNACHRTGS